MRIGAVLLALLLSQAATLSAPASPEEMPPSLDATSVARQLAGINRSLETISAALASLLEQHETIVLLRRIDIEERRLSPLGEQLRRVRDEAESRKEEISRLEAMIEEAEERLSEAIRSGSEADREALQQEKKQIESILQLQEEQLAGLDLRIREAEDDLARGRRAIRILDEQLQERLGEP
jgi:chromosome segregation ATPase